MRNASDVNAVFLVRAISGNHKVPPRFPRMDKNLQRIALRSVFDNRIANVDRSVA